MEIDNNNEHEEMSNTLVSLRSTAQRLYEEHHNGDKKLNRKIMDVRDHVNTLESLMKVHRDHTSKYDKIVGRYNVLLTIGKWLLGIVTALTIAYFGGMLK